MVLADAIWKEKKIELKELEKRGKIIHRQDERIAYTENAQN